MPADETLNPFDVEGLEKSLSDSATRVSTIWISYLLFGLYLLVTAGTATNKQLLLAEPIKLPALGTEVPLVSFFVISPILFVLLQFYVLLQTLLLGRTAKAYNDALNRTVRIAKDNAIFRERLANTIFAQIFAGAPREREGWVGNVLRAMSWFTLVGSPILVLLTFQVAFLPYHSQELTWVHRVLIYLEIAIAFTIWPAVVNPAKEFAWYRLDLRFWRSKLWSRRQLGRFGAVGVLLVSTFGLSFPGEWHINLLSFRSLESRACGHWMPSVLGLDHVDRISLKGIALIDPKTYKKMNEDAPSGAHLYEGARSKDLNGRDFVCGEFENVDFRRVSLEHAHFEGSRIVNARLDGAKLSNAYLDDAHLNGVILNDVTLVGAFLRRAEFNKAKFNDVDLIFANLAGIDLSEAILSRVTFGDNAKLSGANLISLKADGDLKLIGAHLEGASFQYAELGNVDLKNAIVDGADFYGAAMPANPQFASSVGIFQDMPKDWERREADQKQFASAVADTVCSPKLSEEKKSILYENKNEIVAALIQNALYPRKKDPACTQIQAQTNSIANCPTEQPAAYRVALADRLNNCPGKLLDSDEDAFLRNGNYNGHVAQKQKRQ
jgi:uncharacterized protein YjbI with pentapeptide repeats